MKNSISALKNYLSRHPQVAAAYLFGSRAKKKRGWKKIPDVDIAVLLDRRVPTSRYLSLKTHILSDLERLVTDKVDLIFLNKADPLLCHEVFSTRTLLAERDPWQRAEAEAKMELDYFDFLPFQQFFTSSLLGLKLKIPG